MYPEAVVQGHFRGSVRHRYATALRPVTWRIRQVRAGPTVSQNSRLPAPAVFHVLPNAKGNC